ncbi:MAG TPA: ATP-grasp domain-containing protein [Longimicrobiales bacterium]
MSAVLVTDGEQRAALAIVRSLGRAGHRVYVVSSRRRNIAAASRYAFRAATAPDPLTAPEDFVATIARLVSMWRIDVVLPVAEPALLAVLGARERMGGAAIPFPPVEAFRALSDKRRLLAEAAAMGMAVPEQRLIARPDVDVAAAVDGLPYPVVIKPYRSVAGAGGSQHKLEVRYAADPGQLVAQVRGYPPAAFPLLVQRRIQGPGVGVFLLLWEGRIRAVFAHRRIREKPPSGGVSVYCESVAPPWGLVASSQALLDRFGWSGIAMVEYKLDARSGSPHLMEVNPRFWGSLQLALDAGVDFPSLLIRAAAGRPMGPPPVYRPGNRLRWWWGDVDQLIARLRRSPAELALPPDAPSRKAAILEFLRIRPGDRPCTFRLRDPAPFFRETIDWLRRR